MSADARDGASLPQILNVIGSPAPRDVAEKQPHFRVKDLPVLQPAGPRGK